MLYKRRLIVFTTLLLTVLIIFQFISGAYANAEHMVSYASKPSEIITGCTVTVDTTLIDRDSRKASFQFIPVQLDNSSLKHILVLHSTQSRALYNAALLDDYENIKKINPHYFNGSKYKSQ